MAIRNLSTASITTGTKRSKFWDQSATLFVNTPPVTSGLTHWYDGSDSSTMTVSSGNISAWANKSPASGGPTMAQGTGSRQPNLEAAVRNGKSAVRFVDSTEDNFGSSSQPGSGSHAGTICFAGQANSRTEGNTVMNWGTSNYVGGGVIHNNFPSNATNPNRPGQGYAGSLDTEYAYGTSAQTGWYVAVGTFSGTSVSMKVNGANLQTKTTSGASVAANNEFFIGWTTNPWYSTYGFDGYMGDILIFNRVLSESERDQVATWLMQKWNIS
jgi:hypothetical protein